MFHSSIEKGKRVAIHQPNYLPWLGFFYKMAVADIFIILDTAQFTKNGYQNRVKIKSPSGEQWLTQPVRLFDGAFKPTNEILFANNQWGVRHIKMLQANYGRSKYFRDYFPQLSDFLEKPGENLSSFNFKLISWVAGVLEIKTTILLASEHPSNLTKTERLVDLVKWVSGDTYLSGKGGTKYQDEALFLQSGIKVEIMQYHCVPYHQLWGEFIPGLSAIDLIFNCGTDGRRQCGF
jgi:hypothetical protein